MLEAIAEEVDLVARREVIVVLFDLVAEKQSRFINPLSKLRSNISIR